MQLDTTTNNMPNNEDAERVAIGQTLLDKAIPYAARELSVSDFYDPFWRAAWAACCEINADGKELDPLDVMSIVKRDAPELAESRKHSGLMESVTGLAANYNPVVYVEKIKEAAARRFLIRRLNAEIGALRDNQNLPKSMESIEQIIKEVQATSRHSFRPLAEVIESDFNPGIKELRDGISRKIEIGFPVIDRAIGGGMSPSDLMLVAGLPGCGKSAFVLQVAVNIAKSGTPVAFLSGEMSDKENSFRLVSQAANLTNLNSVSYLASDEFDTAVEWAEVLKKIPLYMNSRTFDMRTLSQNLRVLVNDYGVKVLILDYIQLFKMDKYAKHSRYERITEVSQEVKRIAMRYGVAVIEVAQFNREGAKSLKPSMHDLEGSSQLEKDTSLIFIIDRDETDEMAVTLRIVKGRNTGRSSVDGTFIGRTLTFEF